MNKIKLNIQLFATSGTLRTPANSQGTYFWLDWTRISYSIANNTSKIYWQLGINASYQYYTNGVSLGATVINGVTVHSGGTYSNINAGVHTLFEGELTIKHNNDGTKTFGASISGWTYGASWVSASGNFTLNSIPRQASITSAPNFNDEGNPTINYSNPAGNNVTTLQACIASTDGQTLYASYRDIPKTRDSYTFNLTSEERNVLRNACSTSNNINVNFYIKTILGGNTYYSTATRTLTIINANPIFNNFEFEDINPTTLALTGNNKINVNNFSTIKATIPVANKAEAQKQATMTKYRFSIGDNSADIGYSDENNVYVTINKASSGTYNMYAIDSRNNSTLVIKNASEVINYEQIYIDKQSSNVSRNDNQVGENAILTLNGTFWNNSFGLITNTIKSINYRFKKTNSQNWITGTTTITPTINDNNFSFSGQIASDNQDTTWDLDSSYDVEITINDELSSSTISLILNSAIPTMSIDKSGIGIMCVYDSSKSSSLQIDGKSLDQYIRDVVNNS